MTSGGPSELRIDGISLSLAGQPIVAQVSVAVRSGQLVGVLGRNGSGKSTLLRAVYRSLRPTGGTVSIDGADLWTMSVRSAARLRSVVTQMQEGAPELTVAETVLTGRTARQGTFARTTADDRAAVDRALDQVGMGWSGARTVATLSGGERQKVLIARALAQQAPFVVLDEPTNHLDVSSALEVMELLSGLGMGALAALHDLDHAAAYCDRIVVLKKGRVVASGAPAEVLTDDLVRDVFAVRAEIGVNPLTGRPSITLGPLHPASTAAAAPVR